MKLTSITVISFSSVLFPRARGEAQRAARPCDPEAEAAADLGGGGASSRHDAARRPLGAATPPAHAGRWQGVFQGAS